MRIESKSSVIEESSDATLVISSLGGDKLAFETIVVRYQRLLCSLAYSSIGSVNESEDLVQETFVEAWKKLSKLQEPEKLKAWLCGILRFKISHHHRKQARQPTQHVDETAESNVLEPSDITTGDKTTEEIAMRDQERALLWQTLKDLPETYRETLILYYREHRSVAHVANELDLSEDTVKQRLSRGRKLLQAKMMKFVEDALERSSPGHVFTAGVMASLVTLAPPTKAAGYGVTAAKLGTTFKLATIVTFLATASGFISCFFGLRASLDKSRTDRERKAVVKETIIFVAVAIAFVAGLLGFRYLALAFPASSRSFLVLSQIIVFSFVASYLILLFKSFRKMAELRVAERARKPEAFASPGDQPNAKGREYKSRYSLLGFPLVHIKFAASEKGEEVAIGWIAFGEKAYGLLFAWGGFTVAPISVGVFSVGIIGIGAVGVGFAGIGCVGIGLLAMGASAIGYKAYGSLSATGWENAFSQGFSMAKEAAIGPIAYAEHINNELAISISNLSTAGQSYVAILAAMTVLVIAPVVWYAHVVRKKNRGL